MAGNATCYDPQHRPGLESDKYEPCWSGTSDGFSVCCPQGWMCLKNLLCMYTGTSQKQLLQGTLQRGLCTDETFKSKNCPQFCLEGDDRHNNGTTVKNCGNGTGCCHTDANKDCSCSVGSPGALLLEMQRIVSYTTDPSSPITVLLSGTTTSVSTPVSATRTISSSAHTIAVFASTESISTSASSIKTRSTISSTIVSIPTAHNLIAASTAVPAAMTASPSPVAASLSGIPNLGLMIGLPVGIVVAVASLIMAFFLFRRHARDDKRDQHGADVSAKRQWPQNREEYQNQKWDYKTVQPPNYSPRAKYLMYDKPLPIPGDQASEKRFSVPSIMHELPNDEWLAKELPGSPHPSESQRYELG